MNSQHDNTMYRRGVILGLTMAEIVILIVFCLLLLLNILVGKKNEEIKQIVEELNKTKKTMQVLAEHPDIIAELNQLYSALDKTSFDDAFKELLLIKNENFNIKKQLYALHEKTDRTNKLNDLFDKFNIEIDEISDTMQTVLFVKNEFPEIFTDKEKIKELPHKIARLKQEIKTQQNRGAYLQKKLDKLGHGTEKPACWADSSGKTEYIFQVALTSKGIVVHNNKLPNRAIEQKELPIDHISFDKELSTKAFRKSTRALFEWSEKNECRFFVKVFDKTKSEEKKIYKNRLRIVEEHFYKYEP